MLVVTEYEGPSLAVFILTTENALNCNDGLSPLHRIIFNDRNAQWVYCNIEFLDKYLLEFPAQKLDVCFDSDGYNLLHRAIMGDVFKIKIGYTLDLRIAVNNISVIL
jgi:hypothetical protein